MSRWWLLLAASYFVGAIPWGYVIVRWRLGADVRKLGSGNPGATNVLRTTGVVAGVVTLILDVAKGAAPVVAAELMHAPAPVVAGAGLVAVLGHVFSIFLRGRGGKGVATATGALGVLSPFPTLVALAVFVVVVVPTRLVALASVCAAASYPLAAAAADGLGWIDAWPWVVASSSFIAVLIISRHRANIRRLRAGTEPRLARNDEEQSRLDRAGRPKTGLGPAGRRRAEQEKEKA